MLETPLTEAVDEVKNPERRINIITAIIIASVLWGSLVTVVSILYKNMKHDSEKKDFIIMDKDRKIDSLSNLLYQNSRDQLNQEKQIYDIKNYVDSINNETRKTTKLLTSK